ncbi:MAG: serine/threonine-protein kinase [Acidobacteriota bacterium]
MDRGTILGDYKILELLGKGGQGHVYKATDLKLKRVVAIKVFVAQDEMRRQKLASFKHEARLASALDHPNICTVYGLFDDSDYTHIVMEYVAGKTLYELAYHRPLEIRSAVSIAIQVTDALVAAHEQGIIHRDIKPRNVVVEPSGRAVVLDFGIAKLLENDDGSYETPEDFAEVEERLNGSFQDIAEDLYLTVEGMAHGTPASSPPEMALGLPADHRADVFSTGVLLYLLLSGEYPFCGATKHEVREKVINEDPAPVSVARRSEGPIPLSLIAIVRKALRKDPGERFQSMSDMRGALIAVEKEIVGAADADRPERVPVFGNAREIFYAAPVQMRAFSKRWLILAVFAAVTATIGFLAYC